jgi:hypothetical protein
MGGMDSFTPDPRAIEEARRQGNGHVYQIEGDYGTDEDVPPEAIVGAWKVLDGEIVGDFIPNPNHAPGWQWLAGGDPPDPA